MRALALSLALLSPALLLPRLGTAQTHTDGQQATPLHTANVYVAPDETSSQVTVMTPGHEVLIVERNGGWVKVFANIDVEREKHKDDPEFTDPADDAKPRSGWMRDKGLVGPNTPDGDKLLFGQAASEEADAAQPHAPKDAATDARLLYKRLTVYFPDSSLAPESAWRAADIQWQLQKADRSTLSSPDDTNPSLRPGMDDDALKQVMRLYGGKWAALAGFDLLDEKMCADWQGLPKCPERESAAYERYAAQFPDGPKTPEAMWDAAYRYGVLVSMYQAVDDNRRAADAAKRAHSVRDEMAKRFPESDYTLRADALVYRIDQGISTYGSDRE